MEQIGDGDVLMSLGLYVSSGIGWSDTFLSSLWELAIPSKYRSADPNHWPTLICFRCNNDHHQPIIHQNHLLIRGKTLRYKMPLLPPRGVSKKGPPTGVRIPPGEEPDETLRQGRMEGTRKPVLNYVVALPALTCIRVIDPRMCQAVWSIGSGNGVLPGRMEKGCSLSRKGGC
ncbi:hypothetical protein CDAR_391621 [Caerostris darwini]|uniref:Uncharacterized protein n=1 Tax=Caerostris darwini TaxID=1538125 RepID=A0AAV4QIJ5_9ARAC|nr:hypothetical protein CDAR_391621 [Caerostris darwini]